MITRIVKLTLSEESKDKFVAIFYQTQPLIQNFSGCLKAELMHDVQNTNICFTISYWVTEDDLNHYRNSLFFKETWVKAKPLFAQKAEAWSLISSTQI
jgi:heme-degrading monooxygenase HmoA